MKRRPSNPMGPPGIEQQTGAVLITSLAVLLVMTVLGVTAMQGTVLEERMARNILERDIVFQGAEAALREGEDFLNNANLPAFDGTDGLYQPAAPGVAPVWQTVDWGGGARVYPGALNGVGAAWYIIEEMPPIQRQGGSLRVAPLPEVAVYRVTARAIGSDGAVVVVLQSTYQR